MRPDHGAVVFESTDPQRTEVFLADAFGTPTKISGDSRNYRFRLARLGSWPWHVNTIDNQATADVYAHPLPEHLIVVRVHEGLRTNLERGERLGPGDLSLHAQPGEARHVRLSFVRYQAVLVPIRAVAEAARNGPDDELGPLRFDSLRPTDPGAAQRWLRTVEYVSDIVRSDPGAMTQPLLGGAAVRLLAATVLATFPNTWTTVQRRQDRTDATASTLSRALAFIEANADLDISSVDVARASYVTVRAVQLAFRRHLDTTPTAYLRRARLERVHQELLSASPDDGTVISQVAARWGFADASRFTARYRRVYGELPSDTLRR